MEKWWLCVLLVETQPTVKPDAIFELKFLVGPKLVLNFLPIRNDFCRVANKCCFTARTHTHARTHSFNPFEIILWKIIFRCSRFVGPSFSLLSKITKHHWADWLGFSFLVGQRSSRLLRRCEDSEWFERRLARYLYTSGAEKSVYWTPAIGPYRSFPFICVCAIHYFVFHQRVYHSSSTAAFVAIFVVVGGVIGVVVDAAAVFVCSIHFIVVLFLFHLTLK